MITIVLSLTIAGAVNAAADKPQSAAASTPPAG